MKIKEANATRPGKRKMTDAEIKEAIKRDKEWMENIDPDEEIEVPEGAFKDLVGDTGEDADGEDDDSEEAEINDDADLGGEDEGEETDADADGGKMLGALVGGIGGLVVGSILGAAILGDD
jgi:hypothetical protein